jgi:hypothetical protein
LIFGSNYQLTKLPNYQIMIPVIVPRVQRTHCMIAVEV